LSRFVSICSRRANSASAIDATDVAARSRVSPAPPTAPAAPALGSCGGSMSACVGERKLRVGSRPSHQSEIRILSVSSAHGMKNATKKMMGRLSTKKNLFEYVTGGAGRRG